MRAALKYLKIQPETLPGCAVLGLVLCGTKDCRQFEVFGVETVESSHNLISKMRPQIADDAVDGAWERESESNGGQRAACIQFQCQLRVRVRPIKFCCVCAEGGERQLCAADNKLLPSITSSPYCFSHFLCSSTYRAHLPCFNGLPDVLLLCSISAAKAAAAAHQMNAYKNKTAETAATTKTRTTSALPQQAAVCRHGRLRADSSSMFWPPSFVSGCGCLTR